LDKWKKKMQEVGVEPLTGQLKKDIYKGNWWVLLSSGVIVATFVANPLAQSPEVR
jgi:hypothetical protein